MQAYKHQIFSKCPYPPPEQAERVKDVDLQLRGGGQCHPTPQAYNLSFSVIDPNFLSHVDFKRCFKAIDFLFFGRLN